MALIGTYSVNNDPNTVSGLYDDINDLLIGLSDNNQNLIKARNIRDLTYTLYNYVPDILQETGTQISFDRMKIYNGPGTHTSLSPGTGNITTDSTDAKLGTIQKIYHNSTTPIFPNSWVLLGDGIYIQNVLNIIYAEWCGNNRVEYWITQEQI
jgi:hypothetical protein